jgi:hypothetical protein
MIDKVKPFYALWLAPIIFSISCPAYASGNILPWKTYLFVVMAIAAVVGTILSWRNPKTESFMGRFLLAGLYFWILTFAQMIILALIYQVTK